GPDMSYRHPVRPERRKRPPMTWRKRAGWAAVIIGGVLFLSGNVGARIGLTVLPFDPHHVFTQFGGGILAALGLSWATRREGRRTRSR
ncbi:MAG: hypothetical protein ACRDKJ_06865, partial [Actinomycetota bacterium]